VNVRQNMGILKTLKQKQAIGMVNKVRLVKLNKTSYFKKETDSIHFMCNVFYFTCL
jgi:hypothetical protein